MCRSDTVSRMLPALDPIAIGILVLGSLASLGLLLYGVAELRLANYVLRSEPDSVLETTRGGPVELRGTAAPAVGTVRSPFTETPCLAYEYVVEEERESKNGADWTTVASGDEYRPFYLDDGSGSVLIEPPGADFRLEEDARIDVDGGTEPPAPIADFIARTDDVDCQNTSLDLRVFELETGNDRRFRERRLEVGAEVHVLGTARYDTTVSRKAGQVNAAVGAGEAATDARLGRRLRHRLLGYPFVVSDRTERGLGLRAGAIGLASIAAAALAAVTVVAIVA